MLLVGKCSGTYSGTNRLNLMNIGCLDFKFTSAVSIRSFEDLYISLMDMLVKEVRKLIRPPMIKKLVHNLFLVSNH